MRLLKQSHSAEKSEIGIFLNSCCCKNFEGAKNSMGDPLEILKILKKMVHSAKKKQKECP